MSLKVLKCQQENVNTVRTNYGAHVHWYAEVNISFMHQGMEEEVMMEEGIREMRDCEKEMKEREEERSKKANPNSQCTFDIYHPHPLILMVCYICYAYSFQHVDTNAIHPANNTLQGNPAAPDDPSVFLLDKMIKKWLLTITIKGGNKTKRQQHNEKSTLLTSV